MTQMKALNGRECGACSMCCYLFDIKAINKPAGKWCPDCKQGCGGCGIYPARPPECRDFACKWLIDKTIPDHWFPRLAKMVIHGPQRREGDVGTTLTIAVDSRFPNRWREQPYFSDIKHIALRGLSRDEQFFTWVRVGKKEFLILTHREIEFTKAEKITGRILRVGPEHYEFVQTKSKADAMQLGEKKEERDEHRS
jgi:hypothetical protein